MPGKGHDHYHIERRLRAHAKSKHFSKERQNAYIYGGLTNIKKRMGGKRVKKARRSAPSRGKRRA